MIFDNIENVWDDNPSGTPGNETAAHLVASDASKRIGTAVMLQTMPGDEFRLSADCYYTGPYTPGSAITPASMLSSLTSALMGGETYSGVPVSEMPQNMAIISQTMNNPALGSQLSTLLSSSTDASAPQAYLTYLVFDQNLQLIPGKSGVVQVPLGGSGGLDWTTIGPAVLDGEAIRIDGPGYLIVYVNNNSIGKDVYFDNIKIEHYTGTILEENHYYPFGLTLSYNSASPMTAQPYKYNTKELEKSFGLEMYDYGARMQDPQLGVWHQIDPLAEVSRRWSPYSYAYDNPVRYIDPDGMLATDYYNLKRDVVRHVDDGQDTKKLVLTEGSDATIINKAIENNEVVTIHKTTETLDKSDELISEQESYNTESSYAVATDGTVSKKIQGNEGEVENVTPAYLYLEEAGKKGAFDIHRHTDNKSTGEVGIAEPSGADKDASFQLENQKRNTEPNWVLGKNKFTETTQINPTTRTWTTDMIGFYNSKGLIHQMSWNEFKKTYKKIQNKK